jgi:DNA-3-methyladenine glycosylase
VLIRALEPLEGIDQMLRRRRKNKCSPALTAGPGALSAAMGLHSSQSGCPLTGTEIYIEDRGIPIPENAIAAATRVGVAYAAEDALLPYRFFWKGNLYVSKGKGL